MLTAKSGGDCRCVSERPQACALSISERPQACALSINVSGIWMPRCAAADSSVFTMDSFGGIIIVSKRLLRTGRQTECCSTDGHGIKDKVQISERKIKGEKHGR